MRKYKISLLGIVPEQAEDSAKVGTIFTPANASFLHFLFVHMVGMQEQVCNLIFNLWRCVILLLDFRLENH
jgi:hypothetical protein